MSYKSFVKAMKMAPKCRYYTTAGGKTEEEIGKAEDMLQIKFSRQAREFYKKYGYLSFYGNEIYGIEPNDTSGILEGNSVAYALEERKINGLPEEWIPIYNYEDGNMAYLDYSSLNKENEPNVIMAYYDGKNYNVVKVVAEDFGSFILALILDQIK